MATLINGNGNPAIYAAQDADLIASLAGNTTGIAKVGNEFSYTAEDANTISVADGVIVTKEGRRIQLDAGENDTFTIPTGTAGVTNYYIIGYHLHENASGQQVADTFVQLMASATDTIQEDTFRGGASDVYVSLYRVEQDGVNLGTITLLLPKLANISQVNDDLTPALLREEVQTNGHYTVIKLGKLVLVIFSVFNVNMTDHPGGLITSSMPIPAKAVYAPALNTTAQQYRIRIDTNGNLYILTQGGAYISSDVPFVSGELIYTSI